MTTLRLIFSTLILLFVFTTSNGGNIQKYVLQKGIVGKLFIFGKWSQDGGTETRLRYLGKVITKDGRVFKILNSSWIWGLSERATSRILIYNGKNQYVGNYYVTTMDDLPGKLKDDKLIFINTDEDCDKKTVTVINFKNGLPKQFFRKCKGKYGDIISIDTKN